jgi:hypothetical protein
MDSYTMTHQCVLLQHGMSLVKNQVGTCCYNNNHPSIYSGYDIDPIGCKTCIDQENNGIKSYRQGANEKYGLDHSHRAPIVLDFNPNFNCNLTCKICSEHSSSSWAKLKNIKIHKNYNISLNNFKLALRGVDLSKVEEINFSGGEPLLNNNLMKYLDTLSDLIDFTKCKLRFSTNGTIPMTPTMSEFFLRFQLVLARFSIDDIEEGFEYQRYPAKWHQCQTNWDQFLDTMPHNVIPSINRTVSILNVRRLELLNNWKSNYLQTKSGDQIQLIDHFAFGIYSLSSITPALKENIKLAGPSMSWDYVKNRSPSDNPAKLQLAIQQHDTLHSTKMLKFDPDLYNCIFQ